MLFTRSELPSVEAEAAGAEACADAGGVLSTGRGRRNLEFNAPGRPLAD